MEERKEIIECLRLLFELTKSGVETLDIVKVTNPKNDGRKIGAHEKYQETIEKIDSILKGLEDRPQ